MHKQIEIFTTLKKVLTTCCHHLEICKDITFLQKFNKIIRNSAPRCMIIGNLMKYKDMGEKKYTYVRKTQKIKKMSRILRKSSRSADMSSNVQKYEKCKEIGRFIEIPQTSLCQRFCQQPCPRSLSKGSFPTALSKEPLSTALSKEPLATTLSKEPLPTALSKEPLPAALGHFCAKHKQNRRLLRVLVPKFGYSCNQCLGFHVVLFL